MNVSGQTKEPSTMEAWRLMCEKRLFTRKDIAQALHIKMNTVTELTKRLENQQAICLVKPSEKNRGNLYEVVINEDDVILGTGNPQTERTPQKIKRGTIAQQIWNTLRRHTKTDKHLILATSSASESSIVAYLGKLHSAGYLRRTRTHHCKGEGKGMRKGSCAQYSLIRNSGRLHPTQRKDGLWDQNTQTFYPFKKGSTNE